MSLLFILLLLVQNIFSDNLYNFCKNYIIKYQCDEYKNTKSPIINTISPSIETFSPYIETEFYYDENEKRSDLATRYWLYVYDREEYNRIYN